MVRKERNVCIPRSRGFEAPEIGIASRRVSTGAFYRSAAAVPLATPEQTVKSLLRFATNCSPADKHCSILSRVVVLLYHGID